MPPTRLHTKPFMLNAVLVIVGSIAAWLLADYLLAWRDKRLHRGPAAWSQFGSDRTFHSTGWEDTVPPLVPQLKTPDLRHAEPSPRARASDHARR